MISHDLPFSTIASSHKNSTPPKGHKPLHIQSKGNFFMFHDSHVRSTSYAVNGSVEIGPSAQFKVIVDVKTIHIITM